MNRSSSPLWELTRARVVEFLREPEAIFWVFIFPVLLAGGLGIAFRNRPAESLRIGVADGPGAAALAARLDSFPALRAFPMTPAEAADELRTGKLALVVVPGDSVTYVFDPTRSEGQLARRVVDDALQRAAGRADPRVVSERHLTEPGSRYIDFLIPGLLGLNLMGSGMWGIGFNIVQARRKRLLKRLLATPMRKSHYLLSYGLSRFVFMILEVAALVGFGWVVFDVRVHGSIFDLLIVSVVGALAFAGLGLLTASRAQTVEGVSGIMNFVMLPMWIFSGVFFSYARFPDALQPLIQTLPLTPLLDALRSVMIDGAPLSANLARLAVVAAWGVASFGAAVKIFRWN
ncbi:MAG: ABC transporter permease [Gemmatimonadota bacterium]|nr:MAG: ABC transporter permease [Gemmatimonadota bacterium]